MQTLRTLFRASRAEAEDALIDTNAAALLAQHLRDAKVDVERARRGLAALIARKSGEARQATALDDEIARRETDAHAAMTAGEEALLTEILDRIAGLEDRRAQATRADAELQQRIDALRDTLGTAQRRMVTLTDDLRLARSQAMQRRVRGDIDPALNGSALQKAEEMAARLRESGATLDDTAAALADMRPDADLDTRLREAGLDAHDATRRAAILDRIKTKTPEGDDT